jgi:hypothetical protein
MPPAMPRLPQLPRRPDPRRIQWQLILAVGLRIAQEGRTRWERLNQREQREVVRIVRKSRGRPSKLSERERVELRRLVWKAVGPSRR